MAASVKWLFEKERRVAAAVWYLEIGKVDCWSFMKLLDFYGPLPLRVPEYYVTSQAFVLLRATRDRHLTFRGTNLYH